MNIPGFSAQACLDGTRAHARKSAFGDSDQQVTAQLFIDPFRIVRQFGSDVCRTVCDVIYSGCLDSCEGTIDNPKPSRNCIICDERHASCRQICG